ncbi:MAG: phage tail assembly chaperone G [Cellulosilyticaceae bacterium]
MTIELMTNGNPVVYVSTQTTGLMLRKAVQLKIEQEEKGLTVQVLDKLVNFVCEVFGRQFTVQQFYEGLDRNDIFPIINNVMIKVINGDYHTH